MRKILMVGLLAAIMAALPPLAGAGVKYSPGDFREACFQGHTYTWYGSQESLRDFLEQHEGATVGACPETPPVTPPTLPPPVVVDTTPSKQFICRDDQQKINAGILEAVPNSEALDLYRSNRAYTPAVVSLATVVAQGYTLIQPYAGGALTCNITGLAFTGRGWTGDAEVLMQPSSWAQYQANYGIENSLGLQTPNGYAQTTT